MKLRGAWLVATLFVFACGNGDDDDDDTNPTPPCTNGYTKCSGTRLLTCSNQAWAVTQDCAPQECTTINSSTAACSGGPSTCTVGPAPTCTGGATGDCTSYPSDVHYTCDGNEVVECDTGAEANRYNCADLAGDGSIPAGICYNYGGTWEADCLMPEGAPCAFDNGAGGLAIFGCGSTQPDPTLACDQLAGCVSGKATCELASPWSLCCMGDNLALGCADFSCIHMPVLFDCTDAQVGGGTCTNDQCEHSTAGGPCTQDPGIACVGGLTCQNIVDGWGDCQ